MGSALAAMRSRACLSRSAAASAASEPSSSSAAAAAAGRFRDAALRSSRACGGASDGQDG